MADPRLRQFRDPRALDVAERRLRAMLRLPPQSQNETPRTTCLICSKSWTDDADACGCVEPEDEHG